MPIRRPGPYRDLEHAVQLHEEVLIIYTPIGYYARLMAEDGQEFVVEGFGLTIAAAVDNLHTRVVNGEVGEFDHGD